MGSYNPYEWPYNWVTGFITPISGVMGPYLYLVGAHFALCWCQVSGEESSCYRYWIKNDSMENTRVVPQSQETPVARGRTTKLRRDEGPWGPWGPWVCGFGAVFQVFLKPWIDGKGVCRDSESRNPQITQHILFACVCVCAICLCIYIYMCVCVYELYTLYMHETPGKITMFHFSWDLHEVRRLCDSRLNICIISSWRSLVGRRIYNIYTPRN